MTRRGPSSTGRAGAASLAVLFVCTGNICRSPTAEGVVRSRLAAAGLSGRVRVDSAGTTGYHVGDPPDPRSQIAARGRGYDLSDQRARRLEPTDCDRFDLLLAMDRGHLEAIRRRCPGADARLLLDFLPDASDGAPREVPDPYYGGEQGFEIVLDLIERASDGLVSEVRRRLGDAG